MRKDRMFWTGLAMLAVFCGGCAHDDLAPLTLVSAKEVSEQKKQQDAAAAAAAETATPETAPSPEPSPSASV